MEWSEEWRWETVQTVHSTRITGFIPVVLLLSLREDEVGEDEGGHHGEERLPHPPEDVGQTYVWKLFVKDKKYFCRYTETHLERLLQRRPSAPWGRDGTWWFL